MGANDNFDFILFIALAINAAVSLGYFIWYRDDLGTSSTILIVANAIFLVILAFRILMGYTDLGAKVSEAVKKEKFFDKLRYKYPDERTTKDEETVKHIEDSLYVGKNDFFECPKEKECKVAADDMKDKILKRFKSQNKEEYYDLIPTHLRINNK